MKILLDTHVVIWSLTDDPRLSQKAREMICSPDNMIFYSVASLWEIAIKNQKAPERCPYHESDVKQYCEQAGYLPLPIQAQHVQAIRTLKIKEDRFLSNADPFDRMIIAQAKAEECLVLSHDRNFENYDEKCIVLI